MATPFRKALDTGRCMVRYGSGNTLIVKRALSLFRGAGVVPGCLHEQLPQVRVPALVMPPREVRSPLECSEETSPSQLAKARAESKRENTPASTVSANVVMVSIPFMHLSASTRSRQRGFEAYWATLFSMAFFCDSIWRTSEM